MSPLPHLVDWTKPIEAVRKSDGAVFPVTLSGRGAGGYFVTYESPNSDETNPYWNEDGSNRCHHKKWFIRNRAEEAKPAEEPERAKGGEA